LIQSKFTDDIDINPRFSKRLIGILIILHSGMALVLLMPMSLSLSTKWFIFIFLIISLLHTIRQALFIDCILCGAILHYDTLWVKTSEKAELLESYAHPLLIILRAKTKDGKKHSLVLFPDSLDKETFRRIRVRLRHVFVEEE